MDECKKILRICIEVWKETYFLFFIRIHGWIKVIEKMGNVGLISPFRVTKIIYKCKPPYIFIILNDF